MSLSEIRILPPLAIARLGSSDIPLENYELIAPPDGLGSRTIKPAETLYVDDMSGEIAERKIPETIRFRDGDKISPVAPFLEVHVVKSDGELVPLTLGMLKAANLTAASVKWAVRVGNIKAFRRTGDDGDKAIAETTFSDHAAHELLAAAANFIPGKKLPLGSVRYIKPAMDNDVIRLRFTPAKGLVYGASETRTEPDGHGGFKEVHDRIVEGRVIYDGKKPGQKWLGWADPGAATDTNPGQIYAGYDNRQQDHVSWGYLDDECDGVVEVELITNDGKSLKAFARIGAGPPNFAPDGLPIRTINDELLQSALGPKVAASEVSRSDAENIIRRAYETVRLLNTAIMNGNPVKGRPSGASTMVEQDSNDTHRLYAPIMANEIVDNLSVRALHESLFTALRSGAPPWFVAALRQPEEIGDLSDAARRKMPAMMRGADARYLTLTRRQIDAIQQLAEPSGFERSDSPAVARNRAARVEALRYRGEGNSPSRIRPRRSPTAFPVSNSISATSGAVSSSAWC